MTYAQGINEIVSNAIAKIKTIPESEMNHKPAPNKWSKKELIGHLIDSAYNNHQRFLRAEKQDHLIMSFYDQDEWVLKNAYQQRSLEEVLNLWKMTNQHLGYMLSAIPETILHRKVKEHNFHIVSMKSFPENEPTSLAFLIEDYIYHMEYHLAQIIGPNYVFHGK